MLLKNYLFLNNLSKRKFADMLGVSMQTIYNYSRGLSKPRPYMMVAIETLTKGQVTKKDWEKDQQEDFVKGLISEIKKG